MRQEREGHNHTRRLFGQRSKPSYRREGKTPLHAGEKARKSSNGIGEKVHSRYLAIKRDARGFNVDALE